MPTRFRPYQPKHMLVLFPDLREWVPEGHLAHQVSELVDGLELGAFYQPYEEDGRRNAPYEPRMMVKVLIYAYATGVFSSRKIARKLEEDVAFRMLAAGNFPQHRTICEFRRRHLKDFKKLFVQVVSLGQMMGLLEEVEETFEEKPKQVLADAGYCNEGDLQALEARGVDGYVALGREGKRAVGVDPRKYPAKSRMGKKLASLAGQVEYARRKWIAEAPPWLDQGEARISTVQSAGLAVGARGVGLGVSGPQYQEDECADGGLKRGIPTQSRGPGRSSTSNSGSPQVA